MNVTIVVVSHEMSVVKSICNKVAILSNGSIIETGNVDDIFLQGKESLGAVLGEELNGSDLIKSGDYKIIFRNENKNKDLLSKISKNLNIDFTIIWSSFDTYRGKVKGYYIMRVEENKKNILENYLNKEKIEFIEVTSNDFY